MNTSSSAPTITVSAWVARCSDCAAEGAPSGAEWHAQYLPDHVDGCTAGADRLRWYRRTVEVAPRPTDVLRDIADRLHDRAIAAGSEQGAEWFARTFPVAELRALRADIARTIRSGGAAPAWSTNVIDSFHIAGGTR